MAIMDEGVWRGKVYSGGWTNGAGGAAAVNEPATGEEIGRTGIAGPDEQTVDDEPNIPFGGLGASGTGARFGGTANLEAFTDTRRVTIRGDIAPYPF